MINIYQQVVGLGVYSCVRQAQHRSHGYVNVTSQGLIVKFILNGCYLFIQQVLSVNLRVR